MIRSRKIVFRIRTAAILSLVVFLFVRKNFPGVKLMIVVAIIAGLADQIIVSFWGSTMPKTFPSYQLGTAWFIPMFIGPIMMVACFNAAESVCSTIHF